MKKLLIILLIISLLLVPLVLANPIAILPSKEMTLITFFMVFFVSLFLETAIIYGFINKKFKSLGKIFLYSFLINGMTVLAANLSYIYFTKSILLIEAVVVLVEIPLIVFFFKQKYPKALLISVIANVASFIVGSMFGGYSLL